MGNMDPVVKPKIICLTPVKNESWILEKFLAAASLWADHIIIADQLSNDGSREIARKFPKVILIENTSVEFNEPERQKLLIEAARKIAGPRLLITLDADEFLSANFHNSEAWKSILQVPPGTVVRFKWANLRPGLAQYWSPGNYILLGFMDDGSDHSGKAIHSTRIPMPTNPNFIDLDEIMILHYQYTDWDRMDSKHRWYQCWETLHNPERTAFDIYRQYHHMYAVKDSELLEVKGAWFDYYLTENIDIKNIKKEEAYWWDREVLKYFHRYGTRRFRKLDIWNVDWQRLADHFRMDGIGTINDPRSTLDKLIQTWLKSGAYNKPALLNRLFLKLLIDSRW
ncbi:MAG: glycosyltransferase family 2 protein [Nitrosomonadales bacterium]|nr:glycosyltransferase family 2 protein [Nitrosomonadales bacterium]